MILDKIENINKYKIKSIVDWNEILKFLNQNKEGKFIINGDDLFGIVLKYETKFENDCSWESHKSYIDIHYMRKGEERVLISDINSMNSINQYQEQNDYQLFEGNAQHNILLKEGEVLVLFPNEVHKTSIKKVNSKQVQKTVFKLKIE
jgi:biofilm protein TabA